MAYQTVAKPALVEIVIRKSRFLGHVAPVKSEEDAWAFIERIRIEHKEATHNCFAFKVGAVVRMSDDGEPSGTAGRPIHDVIDKQNLSDVAVVVTRYFGGILLGAGGLVRAYSQAAVAAVDAAGIARGVVAADLKIQLDYSLVGRVQYLLQQHNAVTLKSDFGREVSITCRLLAADAPALESDLAEASAGRIRAENLGELQVGADLNPL